MPLFRATLLAACALALTAGAAFAANPERPSFREPKADFHDKELALTYAFGPGSLDFALLEPLSLGVGVDQVFNAQSWYYRATWRLVDNYESGVAIALNGGAIQTRERLAGDVLASPVWGYQGGLLVSLATESGLIFRGGFQIYDTEWGAEGGQQVLLTPEIAYRFGIAEVTLVPSWPIDLANWSWVGLRVRI